MVWPWFSVEKKEGEGVGGAVGFVRRVVAAAMGCFFGCFRIKDSHSHLIPTSQEAIVSRNKNALSSLFLSDDGSLQKGGEGLNPLHEELDVRELKDEAKFLKACGTLLETPVEIRKASGKWTDMSAQYKEEESLNFNSWLPNASIEKLKLEKQPGESPMPVVVCEALGTGSLVGSPSSCMSDGHNTRRDSTSSIASSDIQTVITPIDVPDDETHSSAILSLSPEDVATTAPRKNKSVRFECESDSSASSSASSSQHPKQSGSAGKYSVAKASPYPTPLKLIDGMDTPGTVFPAYLNDMAGRKPTRIRSQYVYSVLDPVEYPSQWEELKDENSDPNHLRGPLEPNDEAALKSTPVPSMLMKDLSVVEYTKDELSLSCWLKPHLPNHDTNNEQFGPTSGQIVHYGPTPGDRPILGLVAAHWKDDENSRISPKWWDGNGIPNTTNKYKEDQKVSWHATPFEERLEKALDEETFIPRRKPIAGTLPVQFNEADESDASLSGLQSSAFILQEAHHRDTTKSVQ
ncbi:protein JASON [Sesamum alatum]|uniref:Protein JASON n=1 Tax=Sesamum alatum TaxID=300844 RepID=A0AAE1YFH3_9LAMI|nr:protein JASON [Sesamum alatum]